MSKKKELFVLVIFCLFNIFLCDFDSQYKESAREKNYYYTDENDKKLVDSFLKFSDTILSGAGSFLGDLLNSPALNECEFRCPNKSKTNLALTLF
jgi:hypothetical protein